jgi:hypothetical protein
VDTYLFPLFVYSLAPTHARRLADLVSRYIEARDAVKQAWPDREAHFRTFEDPAPQCMRRAFAEFERARAALLALWPAFPESWRSLPPGIGDVPAEPAEGQPPPALPEDPAAAELCAFLAFLRAPRSPRKRRKGARRMTGPQRKAMELYGELRGSFTAIGKAMGVSPQAARKHYKAAVTKLRKLAAQEATRASAHGQKLAQDRRGQIDLDADGKPTPHTQTARHYGAADSAEDRAAN